MVKILFYEKPGCPENLKQKNHLAASGYEVEIRDLTTHHWTPAGLRAYFGDKPVSEWFDPKAPQILSGEVDPGTINPQQALVLMSVNPSLIKSPLVKYKGRCGSGLDGVELEIFLGLRKHTGSATLAPQAWAGDHDHS
jgi:nitrogenase-associated protein